jgi:hypothetical protein
MLIISPSYRDKLNQQPGGLLSGAEGRGLEPMNRLRDPIFSMKDSLRGVEGVIGGGLKK